MLDTIAGFVAYGPVVPSRDNFTLLRGSLEDERDCLVRRTAPHN